MKSLLDPTFVYVPAASTDLKNTFRRVKRQLREAAERAAAKRTDVVEIKRKLKG